MLFRPKSQYSSLFIRAKKSLSKSEKNLPARRQVYEQRGERAIIVIACILELRWYQEVYVTRNARISKAEYTYDQCLFAGHFKNDIWFLT